jgi:hypothetical protein
MESWTREVGSVDRVRQGGVGDPARSSLPSCRQPATEGEETGAYPYNDDDFLTDVKGTGSHPASLPR